jgi:hypothetical protein
MRGMLMSEKFDPFVTGSPRIIIDHMPDFLKKYDELARYRQPLTKAEEKSMDRAIMERVKIARKLRRLKRNK